MTTLNVGDKVIEFTYMKGTDPKIVTFKGKINVITHVNDSYVTVIHSTKGPVNYNTSDLRLSSYNPKDSKSFSGYLIPATKENLKELKAQQKKVKQLLEITKAFNPYSDSKSDNLSCNQIDRIYKILNEVK